MSSDKVIKYFNNLSTNRDLAFSNIPRNQSQYLTHGYHRYPAKFIPNLASYLILKNTNKGDLVCDPFGGCGTSLVEAKINGRKSIGIDINPIACLITKTKITPIDPKILNGNIEKLLIAIGKRGTHSEINSNNDRIKYWFTKETINDLSKIYFLILETRDEKVKRFFLCAFSQILKNSSRWLMSSIKPQVDPFKKNIDPINAFTKHLLYMEEKNEEFYLRLIESGYLNVNSKFYLRDARKTKFRNDSIDYIITSPPYVTSYEYADLHQLSTLWLEKVKDWKVFRKRFIGTSYHVSTYNRELNSALGEDIVKNLMYNDIQLAKSVRSYYADMSDFIKEAKRILKKDKKMSLVIGNTSLKGVDILNAEVAYEQMTNLKFKDIKVEKRQTSFSSITPFRDKINGKFTSKKNPNKRRAYQYEYIITTTA